MNLVPCSSKKSSDLLIWRCSPCSRFRNIRTDSVLSGQKLTFSLFLQLVFYLSIKSLANVAISQIIGVSKNTISDWKTLIHTRVADFLVSNPSPLGGPGVVVEMDEAKFGKRKYNKGAYREGQWVLGAVDRSNGNCFLLPCPNNSRGAPTLLPLIKRWILPGSVVYTDEWGAYNRLWAHVKKSVVGKADLELALVDFMFRRRFHATGGSQQISNCFNGYLLVLKA